MTFLKYLRELFTIQPNYNCNDFFWTLTQITCDSFSYSFYLSNTEHTFLKYLREPFNIQPN